ncbi:hypothetical protein PIB30_063806, partial [Stylosanthes scabra]|nr:hypothetical protein [Stylosanthes scabra]
MKTSWKSANWPGTSRSDRTQIRSVFKNSNQRCFSKGKNYKTKELIKPPLFSPKAIRNPRLLT